MHWVVSEFATIYVRMYVCLWVNCRTQHRVQRQGSLVLRSGDQEKKLFFLIEEFCMLFRMLPKVVPFVLFGEFRVSDGTLQCIKNGK